MNEPTITVPLPALTPAQLAAMFWQMDDAQQGQFFDELGQLVLCTPAPFTNDIGSMFGLDWQMYAASQKATALGQDTMRRISENGTLWLTPDQPATRSALVAGLTRKDYP